MPRGSAKIENIEANRPIGETSPEAPDRHGGISGLRPELMMMQLGTWSSGKLAACMAL
jgi:hypothetical protein